MNEWARNWANEKKNEWMMGVMKKQAGKISKRAGKWTNKAVKCAKEPANERTSWKMSKQEGNECTSGQMSEWAVKWVSEQSNEQISGQMIAFLKLSKDYDF